MTISAGIEAIIVGPIGHAPILLAASFRALAIGLLPIPIGPRHAGFIALIVGFSAGGPAPGVTLCSTGLVAIGEGIEVVLLLCRGARRIALHIGISTGDVL